MKSPFSKEQAEAVTCLPEQSTTNLVETDVKDKAEDAPAENECIVLSEKAFGAFLNAITAPPQAPSEKLLAAVARYHRHEPLRECGEVK